MDQDREAGSRKLEDSAVIRMGRVARKSDGRERAKGGLFIR